MLYEAAQINNLKIVIKAAELVPEICYVQEFCSKTLYWKATWLHVADEIYAITTCRIILTRKQRVNTLTTSLLKLTHIKYAIHAWPALQSTSHRDGIADFQWNPHTEMWPCITDSSYSSVLHGIHLPLCTYKCVTVQLLYLIQWNFHYSCHLRFMKKVGNENRWFT